MRIGLIGYGTMGKLIRRLAEEKGHEVAVISRGLAELPGCDVAIDFTVAEAVEKNVAACVSAGVPLVEGTTGWEDSRTKIEQIVRDGNGAMVFGANFSIGVNIFYKIAEYAASLVKQFPEYEAFIEEQHHSRKKDAPSGTALRLKSVVSEHTKIGDIAATRAGNIPGTHTIGFDGPADQIKLTHTARSREGFGLGALAAAEWIVDKKGIYDFVDVFESHR